MYLWPNLFTAFSIQRPYEALHVEGLAPNGNWQKLPVNHLEFSCWPKLVNQLIHKIFIWDPISLIYWNMLPVTVSAVQISL